MTITETINHHDISRFRRRRGRILASYIEQLATEKGRPIHVFDVGGRVGYWSNVGTAYISRIHLLNNEEGELDQTSGIFTAEIGDARSMPQHYDQSFDLVHSNSVIEHVGLWPDIQNMAWECRRVGKHGWVQTPAWEFPIEPHQRLPLIHWFGQPLRCCAMHLSMPGATMTDRRKHVDMTNMLTRKEFRHLFPACEILTERFMFLPKSYTARW